MFCNHELTAKFDVGCGKAILSDSLKACIQCHSVPQKLSNNKYGTILFCCFLSCSKRQLRYTNNSFEELCGVYQPPF